MSKITFPTTYTATEAATTRTTPTTSSFRENCLHRLESQQRQEQQHHQYYQEGGEEILNSKKKLADDDDDDDDCYIGLLNKGTTSMASPTAAFTIPAASGDAKEDQVLIDYLSQYCQPSSSSLSLPLLPPTCWIQDIDPSSLEFLKSLAAGGDGGVHPPIPQLHLDHHPCTQPFTSIPPATTVLTTGAHDLDLTTTPAETSSDGKHKVGIYQHHHGADLTHPRLHEELHRSQLLPVNNDDDGITPTSTSVKNTNPPLMLSSTTSAAIGRAIPIASSFSDPPSSAEYDEQQRQQPSPHEHRLLLTIIENQQRQMHELQIRLDAMGSMMARMESDVRYLCSNSRQNQQQEQGQKRNQQQMEEERLRNLFPGHGIMGGGLGGGPPQQHQQARGVAVAAPHNQAENNAPRVIDDNNNNNPIMILLNNHIHHHPRGIFFPLFVSLFRFLVALPHQLRTILQSTGPGRVYVHLRQRAVELRAFDNVDLGSLMKLLIMLLIFTGRGNSSGKKATRQQRRNGRGGGGQDGAAAAGDDNATYDVYSLLQWVVEYWNGHRMHILILSSLIGYLVQAGLMSFLYKVLWLEREEVCRAWMGPKEAGEEEADANEVQVERDAADENRAEIVVGGDNNLNDGMLPNNRPNPAGNFIARPVVAPFAAAGAIIRRGPNNGGFLYDVRCLILSFLLSLIPAWFPEAVPEPVAEAEHERLPPLAE